MVNIIELNIGRYWNIRLNGTFIGGLAGLGPFLTQHGLGSHLSSMTIGRHRVEPMAQHWSENMSKGKRNRSSISSGNSDPTSDFRKSTSTNSSRTTARISKPSRRPPLPRTGQLGDETERDGRIRVSRSSDFDAKFQAERRSASNNSAKQREIARKAIDAAIDHTKQIADQVSSCSAGAQDRERQDRGEPRRASREFRRSRRGGQAEVLRPGSIIHMGQDRIRGEQRGTVRAKQRKWP